MVDLGLQRQFRTSLAPASSIDPTNADNVKQAVFTNVKMENLPTGWRRFRTLQFRRSLRRAVSSNPSLAA
ncbi:MAG: hypothetical protein WDO73_27250 [Ignavibacteriota bacterium]